jgi:hypothetical protein
MAPGSGGLPNYLEEGLVVYGIKNKYFLLVRVSCGFELEKVSGITVGLWFSDTGGFPGNN